MSATGAGETIEGSVHGAHASAARKSLDREAPRKHVSGHQSRRKDLSRSRIRECSRLAQEGGVRRAVFDAAREPPNVERVVRHIPYLRCSYSRTSAAVNAVSLGVSSSNVSQRLFGRIRTL